MSITGPNYTQIPNSILDNMGMLTMPEFLVIMAVCRKTFGWQKRFDRISLSQLELLTGLSRPTIISALNSLCNKNNPERGALLTKIRVGNSYVYGVNVVDENGKSPLPVLVNGVYQFDGENGKGDLHTKESKNTKTKKRKYISSDESETIRYSGYDEYVN